MKKIIIAGLALALVISGCTLFTEKNKLVTISIEEAGTLAGSFVNKNLLQPGMTATIKEVADENGLYKVVISLPGGDDGAGQEVDSYLSKDGKKFFVNGIDIAEVEAKNQAAAQPAASETAPTGTAPKTAKPLAELYVMAFCPYGVQAETAMAPVVDLLGDKADIKVRYIVSVPGDDLSAVKSLHGTVEGIEDARQLCIAKNYDTQTLWKYISAVNTDCYPVYRQSDDVYKTCWQKAAKDAGINTAKIESCISAEGVALINNETAATGQNGVSGSPTLIINGARSQASRTPEGFKTAICDAFETPPAECDQTLGTTGAAATGGCN